MSVEEIVDSVRNIVKRWCVTETPLIQDASAGDLTLSVKSTVKFRIGDPIMLEDSTDTGELDLTISSITDDQTIVLTSPLQSNWFVSDTTIVRKLFERQYVQRIYIGEPLGIPRYPAITVNPISRHSEWMTLDSTKDVFNLQVTIYVEDSQQEDTFRFLMKVTDAIQFGMRQNIYPLVAPYTTTAITENITPGDTIFKVANANIFDPPVLHRMLLEDPWDTEEFVVMNVLDDNTIQVSDPACHSYNVADGAIAINVTRFIFNSWPSDIQYGKVYRGTMLKAATIDWFAWEERIQGQPPQSPSIL